MQVKCSFCRSPISSESKCCEWCGSNNPVDRRELEIQPADGLAYGNNGVQYKQKVLNESELNSFLNDINNLNFNHKNSSNSGLFGSLMNKIDGNDFESDKIRKINNFLVELDDAGIELIYQKILSEKSHLDSAENKRSSFFNPINSSDLVNNSIMSAWYNLLKRLEPSVYDDKLKNKISQLYSK